MPARRATARAKCGHDTNRNLKAAQSNEVLKGKGQMAVKCLDAGIEDNILPYSESGSCDIVDDLNSNVFLATGILLSGNSSSEAIDLLSSGSSSSFGRPGQNHGRDINGELQLLHTSDDQFLSEDADQSISKRRRGPSLSLEEDMDSASVEDESADRARILMSRDPNTLTFEEQRELKKHLRLLKNRESAQLSRHRKKLHLNSLEHQVIQYPMISHIFVTSTRVFESH